MARCRSRLPAPPTPELCSERQGVVRRPRWCRTPGSPAACSVANTPTGFGTCGALAEISSPWPPSTTAGSGVGPLAVTGLLLGRCCVVGPGPGDVSVETQAPRPQARDTAGLTGMERTDKTTEAPP